MSLVLSSETGMPISRLKALSEEDGNLLIMVRWLFQSDSEDTW